MKADGANVLRSLLLAVDEASQYACVRCKTRPGHHSYTASTCCLVHIANTMCEEMQRLYT